MADKKQGGSRWHRLDNTAHLFPVITSQRESNVYRLSLNLTEPVIPEVLQRALEKTLPRFAAFRVRLHRGFFWHYLEDNAETPLVREEDDYPCRYIDPAANRHFLFRLTYCVCRVNLEVYHVLSDGTGGFQFLQAIVCQYLMLAHPAAFSAQEKGRFWFAQHAVNTEDSYAQNYAPAKRASFNIGRGYRLRGEGLLPGALAVVHAHMAVDEVIALCRQKGVSATQYLCACFAFGIYEAQAKKRPSKLPLNVFVPVNLRNLFPSTTTLNFFSNVYISLPMGRAGLSFDEMLAEVRRQFTEKVNREAMLEKISYTVGGGRSPFIRAAPLPLKMLILRFIYMQSAKSSSAGLSSVGEIKMPAPFQPYVCGASLLLSPARREPVKATICSYGGVFTLSLSSTLRSMDVQRAVIRKLAGDGLHVTVESNGVDYEHS